VCVGACADVPEPEEGAEEQLDPVPLMDRSCVANVLEKVIPCFQVLFPSASRAQRPGHVYMAHALAQSR
jgi:hypothetical protein